MAEKSIEELFHANSDTDFTEEFWNKFIGEVALRIRELQNIKIAWEEVSQQGIQVALDRINEVLGPAAQRIQNVAELGFLTAPSTTSVTLAAGAVKSFVITEGDQRDLFTPSPFLAVMREGNINDFAVGRLHAWDRASGIIEITIDYIHGSAGPFTDWIIASVPGTVIAENEIFEAVVAARDVTVAARDTTTAARDATVAAAGRYWGALASPPAGASLGHQYLDTSTVPNVVKVLTSTGWAPTVTVSIGGVREQDYATTSTGTGPFTVDGGFTRGNVFLNGARLRNGVDVTLTPGVSGTFTLAEALTSGDELSFSGYYANDAVDIYTKSETYSKTEVNNALSAKADAAATTTALGTKADATATTTALGTKFDKAGGTISSHTTINGNLTVQNGDITAYRTGGTTGVIFLNNANNRYLFYDGTSYSMPGASLVLGGGLSVSGAITATGDITAFSDASLKDNVEIIPDALWRVSQVNGYTFNRIDIEDAPRQTGVIAQELQKVLPEAVHENEDGILSVAYGNVVGLLIEAIKELSAKVERLERGAA